MELIRMLIFGVICSMLISKMTAACLCGAGGSDYCTCSGRMQPLPQQIEHGRTHFKAIGDKCWCGRQVVEPAAPPKPSSCAKKPPSCGCQTGYASQTPNRDPYPSYVTDRDPSAPPADAVSIGLAYRNGLTRNFAVPEARLNYGFNRLPINGQQPVAATSNVPEERLWEMRRNVIELRRPSGEVVEEEQEEFFEEEEEEDADIQRPPQLTYGALGYSPERVRNPRFRNVPRHGRPTHCPYRRNRRLEIENESEQEGYGNGY